MPETDTIDTDVPVEWSVLRQTPLLSWVTAAIVAYIVGSLLAIVLVYPFVATPLSDSRTVALYGVIALVGVLLALHVLLPVVHSTRQRSDADSSGRDWDRRDALLVADVVAIQLLLAYWVGGTTLSINGAVAGVLVVLAAVVLPVRVLLEGDGEYDPEAGTITFDGRTVSLSDVETATPIHFGSVTYVRLQLGRDASGPPGVAMPTETYERLAERVEGFD